MTPEEHHQRVRQLFDDLLELPDADRASRLSRAKLTDTIAAQEAERLLQALETAGDIEPVLIFGEHGASDMPLSVHLLHEAERVRTPIGSAEIIRLLSDPARPGMAEVYKARHADAGSIAIKVLRHSGTGYEIRRRFLVETEALRQLDHPHVARLLHAGLIEREKAPACMGLITRFVPGVPIDVWARSRSATEITRAVSRIARAVHHVHLRQILHRDIKPSNIIMTPEDQPVLIDLGVAKFVGPDRDEFASMGQTVAGTLHYMAPEQLTPSTTPVDYRADIYALGVVLFELLNQRPLVDLAGTSEAEALRLKLEQRAVPPRGLGVLSLATQVALIAASPRAGDRYDSAEKMAEDLDRTIEGRSLMARPLGRAQRLALFLRRHPLPVAAATAVTTILLVSAALHIESQRQVAAARARAEDRFTDTRSFARWAIFTHTDALGSISNTTDARHDLIREAASMLERLAEDPVAGPDLLMELAEGYTRLGELLDEELGDNPGALRSFASAQTLLMRHPDPSDPVVRMLRAWLGFRSMAAIDHVDYLPFEFEVLESSLAGLSELEPVLSNDPRLYRWRSRVLCHYSRRQLDMGLSTEEIVDSLTMAVNDADRSALLAPGDAFAQGQPALARFWLAHALYDRQDDRALNAAADAIGIAQKLEDTHHPMTEIYISRAVGLRCKILAQRGEMTSFTEQATQAIQSADRGVAREPNNKTAVRNAEVVRIQLARVAWEASQDGHPSPLREAFDWAKDAYAMFVKRQAREWSYEYEDLHYPPSYLALIERLRSAVDPTSADGGP